MAFVGLTYTGPQNFFQYHDTEPNEFNEEVKRVVPVDELPEEMKKVKWAQKEVNLADLYPENTALRQLKKESQAKTRKTATEFSSVEAFKESLVKHSRGAADPQAKWYTPLTSSHEYGWTKDIPGGGNVGSPQEKKFSKTSSEEAKYSEAMLKQGMI
eukprot:TRINITY_DN5454_c1_g1_i1.p1 TRINITY_DN5454_c1_g1~~TRINITY_DN5454_c1_g1_i1.p1  ORF type:complete len:157 (+),score=30.44 TRINITY_DN5454_c1_g1_i1:59-529(+)